MALLHPRVDLRYDGFKPSIAASAVWCSTSELQNLPKTFFYLVLLFTCVFIYVK